jgi:hypothetical protein
LPIDTNTKKPKSKHTEMKMTENQKKTESPPPRPDFFGDKTVTRYKISPLLLKSGNRKKTIFLVFLSTGLVGLTGLLIKNSPIFSLKKDLSLESDKVQKVNQTQKSTLKAGVTEVNITSVEVKRETQVSADALDYSAYESYVDYTEPYKE